MRIDQVAENIPQTGSLSALVGEMQSLARAYGHAINLFINQWNPTSPAQITGNQNDYAIADALALRLSSDAARDITGFDGGEAGRFLLLINVGAQNIVLKHQNAGSVAANRIITKDTLDLTIAASGSALLFYDDTTARWRVLW